MIEVFKTDVESHDQATMLLDQIHRHFAGYKANFDLQDCDNILRVKSTAPIDADCLIELLSDFGVHAECFPMNGNPATCSFFRRRAIDNIALPQSTFRLPHYYPHFLNLTGELYHSIIGTHLVIITDICSCREVGINDDANNDSCK